MTKKKHNRKERQRLSRGRQFYRRNRHNKPALARKKEEAIDRFMAVFTEIMSNNSKKIVDMVMTPNPLFVTLTKTTANNQ